MIALYVRKIALTVSMYFISSFIVFQHYCDMQNVELQLMLFSIG